MFSKKVGVVLRRTLLLVLFFHAANALLKKVAHLTQPPT